MVSQYRAVSKTNKYAAIQLHDVYCAGFVKKLQPHPKKNIAVLQVAAHLETKKLFWNIRFYEDTN